MGYIMKHKDEYSEATLLLVIDQAKEKYLEIERYDMVAKLNLILKFLPDYPLMALMEAEAQNLPKDFRDILQDTYKLKSFK